MTPTATRPQLTEAQFQQQVIDLAKLHGYTLIYHTHDSRRSQPGFPDLVLVSEHRGRALFRELKTGTGRLTEAQFNWLAGMKLAKLNADVWRPADLESGLIIKQLRGVA
ncbi:nuclease [Arthrobacter phage Elesar]|uniref:Nuclease n=1 Tax=Arthrobacter phage Elesar TaxID=2510522 RepID=A0A411CQA5_9CAUD|nr:nuclease [Arthrobacter phage Elesar]QAY16109.1 nuclease [Arthrobacter phage Elesar]